MKKIIFIAFFFLAIGLAPHAFAAAGDFVPLAPIPGLTQGITADQTGLANFFNNLYKFSIGLAAALAVIMIIWGGLEYATQDSISKKSDGKERIYNAIFGLVLVLAPALVFSIINPAILNLSINLPPLDTKTTLPVAAPLPTCSSYVKKNCTPPKSFDEGYYASPPQGSGAYCVQPTNPSSRDAAYLCTGTLEKCSTNPGSLIKSLGATNVVGGTNGCVLYP
ncbi:hypothetical protein D4R49_01125 [bacterium]|nr:MAG: hypothetical protein D4R49_01125 [bacterium]